MQDHETNPAEPLSPEEIIVLRAMVPVAEELKREAEYRLARRLVLRTWKASLIWLGGLIAALLLLREQLNTLGRAVAAFWRGLGG